MKHSIRLWIFASFALLGCEEERINTSPGLAAGAAPTATGTGGSGGAPTAAEGEAEAPPRVEFQEVDFAETERSRDPFRTFDEEFAAEAKGRVRSQRSVVLPDHNVDELKLVGIVTRIHPAVAMVVDQGGKGHVITRGQFIGKPSIVTGGTSGAQYEINWRVDRIRANDVVLVREDPSNPDVPSASKVIPLRPDRELVR